MMVSADQIAKRIKKLPTIQSMKSVKHLILKISLLTLKSFCKILLTICLICSIKYFKQFHKFPMSIFSITRILSLEDFKKNRSKQILGSISVPCHCINNRTQTFPKHNRPKYLLTLPWIELGQANGVFSKPKIVMNRSMQTANSMTRDKQTKISPSKT